MTINYDCLEGNEGDENSQIALDRGAMRCDVKASSCLGKGEIGAEDQK